MALIFTRPDWYGTAEHLAQLWQTNGKKQARAIVVTHSLGVERLLVDDDLRESLVTPYDDEPLLDKSETWRHTLIERGWTGQKEHSR